MSGYLPVIIIGFGLLNGMILLLAGVAVNGIMNLNKRLGEMNGRIGKIEVRNEAHDKTDTIQFTSISQNLTALWEKVNDLRSKT